MNKQDIHLLFRYNAWAKARILNAAEGLSDEQFAAPAPFPHGGIRGMLVHALFAEWIWRNRWEGNSPAVRFKEADFPTVASLRARWEQEEKNLQVFLETLTDERLNAPFEYQTTRGNRCASPLCGPSWCMSSTTGPSIAPKRPPC